MFTLTGAFPTLGRLYHPRPSRHNMLNQCWFNVGLRRWTIVNPPLNQRLVSAGYMWPDHAHIGRSLRVKKHAWTLIKAVYCIKVIGN